MMAFSKQHYERICGVIRKHKDKIEDVARIELVGDFVKMFVDDNPKFEPQRFIECIYKK